MYYLIFEKKAEKSDEYNDAEDSLKELKQSFDLISNKDGVVTTKEILSLMKSVGQNPTNY
jgi:Ca2+-binding EF-hand superfamily protein